MLEKKSNWINVLILVAILILCISAFKKFMLTNKKIENFTQDGDFLAKHNNEIYDKFYLENYDNLMKTDERVQYEVAQIIKTDPSLRESVFLDVGSGTGKILHELSVYGYRVFGLDSSIESVDYVKEHYKDLEVKHGDALDLMMYDKGSFTHITCMYFTLYEMADKATFVRNVSHWLQRGGYFIVHLVDKDEYSTISPAAKIRQDIVNEFSTERITESNVVMPLYNYNVHYQIYPLEHVVCETFTNKNGQIRKNENKLYLEEKELIIKMIEKNGFTNIHSVSYGSVTGDHKQHIYTFQKH